MRVSFRPHKTTINTMVVGALAAVLLQPLMAQEDPLGDLIQQKTGQSPHHSQRGPVASQPVAPASAPVVAPAAAAPSSTGISPSAPSTNPSSSAWGQAGAIGAAAGALSHGGLNSGALNSGILNNSGLGASVLSGLDLPNLFGGSAGNVAGVLQYCIQNNYVNRAKDRANSLKEGLLNVAGLQNNPAPQTSNSNYANGLAGILVGGEGEQFDFGKIQANLKEKACDYVLEQAPSLL